MQTGQELFRRFSGISIPGILLMALAGINQAQAAETSTALMPFSAEYRISVNRIPTPIRAELVLEATDQPDRYRMEFKVDSMLMKNTETTVFDWNQCEPETQQYRHEFRGFGRRRHHQMDFFWDDPAQIVTTSYKGRQDPEFEAFEIPEGTLDDLTMLLKTRCLLTQGQEFYEVTSAYGSGTRDHRVRVVGSETLDTPMGELETMMIERARERDLRRESDRHTMFWVAPALDYMLVRVRHVEDSGLYGEINMRSYHRPEQPAVEESESDAKPASETTEAVSGK